LSAPGYQDISEKLIIVYNIVKLLVLDKKFNLVALGGTFDHLHLGHRSLLKKAFEVGNSVLIGITGDSYLKKYKKKSNITNCYESRVLNLINFIKKNFKNTSFSIIKLDDKYGPTVTSKEIQALVTSTETKQTGLRINRIRVKNGLDPLLIITVDLILSCDGIPLSSTRIRSGEINSLGKILKKNLNGL